MEQWKRGTKEKSRRYVSEAYVQTLAAAAGISMITAFLFYRSVWGMCTFFVFAPLCLKFRQKREAARREVQIQKEFLTAMESVSGALMAGYSLESAWKYAQQETEQMYGMQGIFSRELRQLNQKLFMHEPMEQLLYELAERCDNEEIYHFAEILLYAKRSGGNMTEIIHRTVCRMQEKHEVLREITENDDAPVTADAVVPDGELAGIYGCVVWKSGWGSGDERMSGRISGSFVLGREDCRYSSLKKRGHFGSDIKGA